jgi:hypothetical protein
MEIKNSMDDKKKSIIYFIVILLLAVAFVVLYLLDSSITESEGQDAFTEVIENIKPALENDNNPSPNKQEEKTESNKNQDKNLDSDNETTVSYEEIKVINWDANEIDSVQIFSPRKDFTLINHGKAGEKKWSIRSPRVNAKIASTNNALFKLLNVFTLFKTDNNLTRDYSEFSKYFEYPACTVVAHFKDGSQEKLTFIRIAGYDEFMDKTKMMTWARVNEETLVYAATYNILERFLVAENLFLRIY